MPKQPPESIILLVESSEEGPESTLAQLQKAAQEAGLPSENYPLGPDRELISNQYPDQAVPWLKEAQDVSRATAKGGDKAKTDKIEVIAYTRVDASGGRTLFHAADGQPLCACSGRLDCLDRCRRIVLQNATEPPQPGILMEDDDDADQPVVAMPLRLVDEEAGPELDDQGFPATDDPNLIRFGLRALCLAMGTRKLEGKAGIDPLKFDLRQLA